VDEISSAKTRTFRQRRGVTEGIRSSPLLAIDLKSCVVPHRIHRVNRPRIVSRGSWRNVGAGHTEMTSVRVATGCLGFAHPTDESLRPPGLWREGSVRNHVTSMQITGYHHYFDIPTAYEHNAPALRALQIGNLLKYVLAPAPVFALLHTTIVYTHCRYGPPFTPASSIPSSHGPPPPDNQLLLEHHSAPDPPPPLEHFTTQFTLGTAHLTTNSTTHFTACHHQLLVTIFFFFFFFFFN